ncbi:hypothetical protein [Carboxylicivirga marina]|uniref:hypothetical protein n=1 Tax=Carboxylicivirga marina TaxID=2800988 RepID=UPI00259A2D72|nr:hypothetical protein [uncultured Carboxylicivirga sp.]
MTAKNKRYLLKAISIVVVLISVTLLQMGVISKNKIHSGFNEIRFSVSQSLATEEVETDVLYYSFCQKVREYVKQNPIEIDVTFPCEKMICHDDILDIDKYVRDLMFQVNKIEIEYLTISQTARRRTSLIQILSLLLVLLFTYFIDKKYKDIVEQDV